MGHGKEDESLSWSCWLRTLFATSGALSAMMVIGIAEAQSAVILFQLRKSDSFIRVTQDQEAWIASLGLIATPISAILVGLLIDMFGRKKGLQYIHLSMGLGFAFIAFARNVNHIYIGRILCGVGTGFEVSAMIYIAEVCTKKQRSDLFALVSPMFSGGVALSTIMGGYLSWKLESFIFSCVCFFFFILEFFIPESPSWHFKTGKEDACIRSLKKLGRNETQVCQELTTLKLSTMNDKEVIEWGTFLQPTIWKPLVIMSCFFFLQSASGIFDVIFYAVDFVERLGTGYDPLTLSITLSITRFLMTATFGVYFQSRLDRKSILVLSASGMTVASLGMSVYEYVFRLVAVPDRTFRWVPVGFAILYMASALFGMVCLPFVMPGEVFPLKVRGTMASVTFFVGYTIQFVFIKIYFVILNMLQIYELLFGFAAMSFIAVLFGIFVLPETHNKSLFEIEQSFLHKKVVQDSNNNFDVKK